MATKTITIARDPNATDTFPFFAVCSHDDGRDGDHEHVFLDIEDTGSVTDDDLERQALADCPTEFGGCEMSIRA